MSLIHFHFYKNTRPLSAGPPIPAVMFLINVFILLMTAVCSAEKPEVFMPDPSKYIQVTKTFKKNMKFLPGGQIRIDTGFMGNLIIEGWERPQVSVTAVASVWGVDHDGLMKNIGLLKPSFKREETRISVITTHPEYFHMGKIDYHIKTPAYRTDFEIVSVRGFVSMKNINGWIEANTRIGYLSLINLSGYLSAKTEKGDILIQLKGNRWEGLQASAVTSKGNIKLYMPSDYSVDLTLITKLGKITTDYPPFLVEGETTHIVIGEKKKGQFIQQKVRWGGPNVVIQTDDGDINFKKYDRDIEYVESVLHIPKTSDTRVKDK